MVIQEAQSLFDPRVREVLEIVSFIGTIVLAALGFLVLLQLRYAKQSLQDAQANLQVASESLRVAKNDLKTRVEREAVTLAAQLVERFGREVIPDVRTKLEEAAGAMGERFTPWTINNYSFDQTSLPELKRADAWVKKLQKSDVSRNNVGDVLNQLEAVAMYFSKGAADEQVAYPSIGATFCRFVELCAPLLILFRMVQKSENMVSGPFQNTIKIYEVWSQRIKAEHLQKQRQDIDTLLSGIHTSTIPPLGMEDKT